MIVEAAVRHVQAQHNGAVRFDPRVMGSIPTRFDHERDVLIAPTPTRVPLAREERDREAILVRLGVQRERIEDYTAADSARSACRERERYGAAILGLTRRSADGASWRIRVYLVAAESRQVYDLVLSQVGRDWVVIGEEELLRVSS